MNTFDYHRRPTISVAVGNVQLGSDWPVRVQSMTNTDTNDVAASTSQCLRLAQAGCEIVRLTAQGQREARAIGHIRQQLRERGCTVPLVADIHFNPRAAYVAAAVTDKVRINPGNFVDPARQFKHLDYTDEEYRAELQRINDALVPFIDLCRQHHTAVRLGVNHGSLSDRIMSRYGNTAAGMVESVMEYLRVFVAHDFNQVVISMKASNVVVMVEAVRRLVAAMDAEGMHFPLHLGVTEAGFGEDGRVKSAVGIGTLMAQGLGDTIRVSLSEDPVAEVPVAQRLVHYVTARAGHRPIEGTWPAGYDPLCPAPRRPISMDGHRAPVVVSSCPQQQFAGAAFKPDFYDGTLPLGVQVVTTANRNIPGGLLAALSRLDPAVPAVARVTYPDVTDPEELMVMAGADLGPVAMSHLCDGIWIDAPQFSDQEQVVRIAFEILQAARLRLSQTEFISCPSCGRTLFDLPATVQRVKQATAHLTHLKIAVMGCIVNGPGEMADADYGYVGAGAGRVSLYRGKQCVEHNLPASEAITHLIALIKQNGDWTEPIKN